jgi:probable F420-dependent oxidoreductase
VKIDAALLTQDLAKAGDAARALEGVGCNGGFTFEGPHDPFFPLVLAARETTLLELYTAVAIAFARNPMTVAQLAWDLQGLSNGRFSLGLGSQIRAHIERRFGQPWSHPAARMREFVLALRAIWESWQSGAKLDFRGEFYVHTLMTPFFNPGPLDAGPPRILLAGVGPRMTEVAGEVADGFLVHPFHSEAFVRDETLPALERGLARGGRARADFEIAAQVMVALGRDDGERESALQAVLGQIAFYGSTPAYSGVLEKHGWGALQPELNALSKRGDWSAMTKRISDEMVDAIAVVGTPAEVALKLVARCGFAQRVALVTPYGVDPSVLADLVAALRAVEAA